LSAALGAGNSGKHQKNKWFVLVFDQPGLCIAENWNSTRGSCIQMGWFLLSAPRETFSPPTETTPGAANFPIFRPGSRNYLHTQLGEKRMRSDLVFEAVHTLRNRYMLCQLASKATRKFHRPNTRIQDTTNDVLHRIADAERQNVILEPETASEAQRRAA
jgi:hypothetical protein